MERFYDDTFLGKWLNGKLSKEELNQFNSDPEYKKYLAISKDPNMPRFPEFKIDAHFEMIWKRIQLENSLKKAHKLLNWSYAFGASLVLFFGYTRYYKTRTDTTPLAEQRTAALPNNSSECWDEDCKIKRDIHGANNSTLTHFDPEKRSAVPKSIGQGDVLGTRFSINSRTNYYSVICHEGNVSVKVAHHGTKILTPGKAYRADSKQKNTKSKISREAKDVKSSNILYADALNR